MLERLADENEIVRLGEASLDLVLRRLKEGLLNCITMLP